MNPLPRKLFSHNRTWFWILGHATRILKKGERIETLLRGAYKTEDEANLKGFELFQGDFKVYELPTVDRHRAGSMIREQLFDDGATISEVLKPMRHDS